MTTEKTELTAQEMTAARMFSEDGSATSRSVGEKLGMNYKTLQRRMRKPNFQEYMAKIRAEREVGLKKQAQEAVKKIDFSLADGIRVLARLAQLDPDGSKFTGQVKAIELLGKMLRWMPEGAPANVVGEGKPDEPDIYKPAWMQ